MKKGAETDEMQPEYDFSKGVHGKHYRRYQQGHTVTVQRADGTSEVQEFPATKAAVAEAICDNQQ